MNARRMFVDLAHIHESAFWDAVTEHDRSQPLIDTHTGVAGVTPHWRNLTDNQVKAIADTGGVVGIIFAEEFLRRIGSATKLPERLPPELEQGVRATMVERSPSEAQIPLDRLAAADFPKLVVSGGHSAAFEAVCDVLGERLPARREVLPGAGHSIQRAPGYSELLTGFIDGSASTEQLAQ